MLVEFLELVLVEGDQVLAISISTSKKGNPVSLGPTTTHVNMVACGGQATIPVMAAVPRVAKMHYARD